MIRLVIETATAACSVALLDGERVIAAGHDVVGRGHAERLMPMIAALPDGGRADAILVGCGPGSFTGVRVGVAAARALALGWGVAAHGYPTLALLAATALAPADAPSTLAIAMTGGHGQLFVQRFAGSPVRPLDELASLTPADAAQAVPDAIVIGSGAAALVAARGWGEALDALPAAADLGLLPADLAALPPTPIYGRAPDAKLPGGRTPA
ncbi:tRNA threonylcarbamoyl adenosine modification protein YeaZ [Sphingomonas zeicaulis]|uniref:tRNA (adenosine(37)-N6)-threonylcarbamoyltransferase complex dimerization subunit type 1 TsaB n=1 Tax=Sphingomonas zeicaulis TaxID=1632740 RepID=UPI003D1FAD81